jgi:hypothetical protein
MDDQQEFIDYIVGLAPDEETALLVLQRPVVRNGVHVTYLDGELAYTFPSFMPDHPRKDGESWYMNTGSYIPARFNNGRPSASTANCTHVLAMMLDDIGTKSKVPDLPPTWIMETSEGSFQWGYAFDLDHQPTTGEFSAAIKAIAMAGYTDPGAINPVRNFRIPGSVNVKPGRNAWRAKRIEWHPERQFSVAQICEALNVTPDEADTAVGISFNLKDTGSDNVLQWLNDKGMVLGPINNAGWLDVVCPNHAQHTDGQSAARYKPLDRSFCCYHGHCQDLDSQTYLAWVAENGGPKVAHGLRDELLAQHMQAAMSKLSPTEAFPDEAARVIAEVERKEVGRVDKAGWYERFAYIVEDDAYFDMDARTEISRGSFNAIFRHVNCKSIHVTGKTARRIEASVCYDENRSAANARLLRGITYAAGDGVLVSRDGDVYGNRWRDARPDLSGVAADDVSRWLDHCRVLVPEEAELNHCLDVMAFKLQNPRVKVNHAILHGGDEGSGKDTMWAPFIWSVCGPGLKNRGLVDNDGLTSQWGYALESEILILNELKEPDAKERRTLANKLKPIIAAPPETLPINRKGLHPYDMVNRMMVLAFTNDPVPISISSGDRRWFCIWSAAGRMPADEAQSMWTWYRAGGFETIARWLADRDVSKFNPAAPPLWTEFKENLIENGMSIAESFIVEQIRAKSNEFRRGVVATPFFKICESLTSGAPGGVKIPQAALLHALKEAGWVDMGRIGSFEHSSKRHIYAAPDLARTQTKSYLRNLLEPATSAESNVRDFPGKKP